MNISQLFKNVDVIKIIGNTKVDIQGIEYDSRRVRDNYLFVCISGFSKDGHDFVPQSIENGAVAIMTEKDIQVPPGITCIKVANTRKAMALISKEFYGAPDEKIKIIGVTGTNGKTTVTYFIKSILENAHKKTGIIGTINNIIGDRVIPSSRTTPESPDLFFLFDCMLKNDIKYAAMEVSSHSLELNRVESCTFEVGVFTNLTQDHLDFHKTFERYVAAKAKLFKQSKKSVINIDDKYSSNMLKNVNQDNLITYAVYNNADVTADNISINQQGVSFRLKIFENSTDLHISIPGIFTVYNALAAAAACYSVGIDIHSIKKGLENIKSVPGRFEVIQNNRGYTILLDYAHTPDGLENILKTVNEFASKRIITLFGAGGDRDATKRPKMGKIAAKYSDLCIITSDNPRTEDPMKIIKQIEQGVKSVGCEYVIIENRYQAIKYALEIGEQGDVIILAGKGHENYQILKDKVIEFDEKKIVKELLNI